MSSPASAAIAAAEKLAESKLAAAAARKAEAKKNNPAEDRWTAGGVAPDRPMGGVTRLAEIPLVDDFQAFQRVHPRWVEGYSPDRSMPDYKLPADPAHFGLRAAAFVLAAVRCNYNRNLIPDYISQGLGAPELAKQVERSLGTDVPSTGGALVMPVMLAGEMIPLLRRAQVFEALGARHIAFSGGEAIIPGVSSGASGGWIDERGAGSVSTLRLFKRKIAPQKAYAVTAITRELQEESVFDTLMMVRDDLVAGLAEVLENGFINGDGTSNSIRGLKYFAGLSSTALGARVDVFTMRRWKRVLAEANVNYAPPRRIGTLGSPALEEEFANLASSMGTFYYRGEMGGGNPTLEGHPFRSSNFIATDAGAYQVTDAYHGDFSQFVIATSRNLAIESSQHAQFTDEDSVSRSAFLNELDLVKATIKCGATIRQTAALLRDTTIRTADS